MEEPVDLNWISQYFVAGLVSVIIPLRNREDLISETLDSIQAQSYRPIEIIIVDDGSDDASLSTVFRWRNSIDINEDFTVVILSQEHRGAQAARNKGIGFSNGEYIHLFDSDDIMHPEKLKMQISALKKDPELGFSVCDFAFFKESVTNINRIVRFSQRDHSPKGHIEGVVLNFQSTLYRRHTILMIGRLNEDLEASQDFEFNFRLFAKRIKGLWIPKVLVFIRDHVYSITGQRFKKYHGSLYQACLKTESLCREEGLASKELLDTIGRRIAYYLAIPLRQENETKLSFHYYLKAFRLMCWNSKLRTMAHWIAKG